jgi:hypothetical protein
MSHLHVRPYQYNWDYDWSDDCPPPPHSRVTFTPPPARARPAVDLPACKPHGGVNTNWSGNKCAELSESSSLSVQPTPVLSVQPTPVPSVQPTPVAQQQPPKHDEPATADQAVQPDNQAHPSSMTDNLGFDVAVGLGLVLAFALVRRAVLALIEKPVQEQEFERDDAV